MILTDDICCSFAAFFISIVRRFSSRSSCNFSRSSSRTALLIMRLFSRSTSFSGLSRPNTLPIVVKLALCVTTVELVRLVRRLERDGDCAGERNDLIDSDWRFAQFTGKVQPLKNAVKVVLPSCTRSMHLKTPEGFVIELHQQEKDGSN